MTSSGRSETPPPTEHLIVGELVGPFGIVGEVKLYPLTDFPERLRRYRRLVLALPDGSQREVRVQRARPHKNLWILKLRDVNTPEEAEALRGAQVMVPAHPAEPLLPTVRSSVFLCVSVSSVLLRTFAPDEAPRREG